MSQWRALAIQVRARTLLRVAGLALLIGLLALPPGAAAHDGTPVKQERVQAGPYTLELRHYSTPRSGQNLLLLVVPVAGPQPTTIRVAAAPGAGQDTPVARVRTAPDPDDPNATDALVLLSATGLWVITIEADGTAGAGRAETALIAAAPGAAPIPVGWALGLSPLAGIVAFAAAQRRWLRGVRSAE